LSRDRARNPKENKITEIYLTDIVNEDFHANAFFTTMAGVQDLSLTKDLFRNKNYSVSEIITITLMPR
jgi:hypothetical protein